MPTTVEKLILNERARLYTISADFQVYDENTALAVEHLLKHLELLLGVAGGIEDQSIADYLSKYPQYGVEKEDYAEGVTPESVTQKVADECSVLLQYVTKIASFDKHEDGQWRDELIKAMKARIPFFDFRAYPKNRSVMIAQANCTKAS